MTEPEAITVRQPAAGSLRLDFGELWRYRDLLLMLVWRNAFLRYKQSVVGVGWALIRPLLSMLVFTVIFGRLAGMPSDGMPYPLFTYAALLPWTYFAGCLGGSAASLVGGAHVLTKVYFPRLILPLSELFTGLIDFLVSLAVLAILMVWYRSSVTVSWPGLALLPLFMLAAMATALAFGLWLTALSVRYRDIQQLMPFVIQIWFFLTPVVYPASLLPPAWRLVYSLNPMTGVVTGFRWALLGGAPPDWAGFGLGLGVTAAVLAGGLCYFRRTERTLVDII